MLYKNLNVYPTCANVVFILQQKTQFSKSSICLFPSLESQYVSIPTHSGKIDA